MLIPLLLWLLVAAAAAFVIYAHLIEPRRLQVTRRRIHIANLPPALEGLTIAHLSDLHVKSERYSFAYDLGRRAVALALAEKPDLFCLTGDVGQASRHIGRAVQVLEPLAHETTFVVMGNHDHDKMLESEAIGPPAVRLTVQEWREVVEAKGLRVLLNENALHQRDRTSIAVVGVGDPSCGWDDLPRALAGVPPADLRLLLVHSPDLLDDPLVKWADLVLCGHTHGGQVTLPGVGSPWAPVWRDRRRSEGLLQVGDALCLVSRGICAGIKTRFRCRPQVLLLTLTAGSGDTPRVLPRYPLTQNS